MKRIFIYIFLCLMGLTYAVAQSNFNQNGMGNRNNSYGQNRMGNDRNSNDSTRSEVTDIPVEVHQWHIDERFGRIIPTDCDTLQHRYQNASLNEGMNGEFNHLGNIGSPRLSRIFFNRDEQSENFFIQPYSFFIKKPSDFFFTNTKSPFTNLSYLFGGGSNTGEDLFKAYFATNINKRFGVGFQFDYVYGRGNYNSQATSLFNGTLFASYRGERYGMHFLGGRDHMKMAENGGIINDKYITNPEDFSKKVSSSDIPTWLDQTWNRNDMYSIYLTQHYNVGFHKEKKVSKESLKDGKNKSTVGTNQQKGQNASTEIREQAPFEPGAHRAPVKSDRRPTPNDSVALADNDTIIREFVPVSRFIHTMKLESNDHRYISYQKSDDYYLNNYLPGDSIKDQVKYFGLRNTVGIELCEGFNKWMQSGLIAYATHELRKYELPDSVPGQNLQTTARENYNENLITIGAELSRQQGKAFHYRILGETTLTGATGQFRIEGNANFNFKFLGDSISLKAKGFVKNLQQAFIYRHYHSKHLWWDNNSLSKEMRTRIEGEFEAKRLGTRLRIGAENIKNYTYLIMDGQAYEKNGERLWNHSVKVNQESDNIQVINATLQQNLKLGILHWDNEITYQKSSNQDVLPLPDLSLYSNLYLSAWLVKNVLRTEVGADVRYFSKYYAPDYSAPIGNFVVQNPDNQVEVGNYPIVNAYINFQWKRTRFYIMYTHLNQGTGKSNYFLTPHYAYNPSMLKFGISWSFYN